jgi:hypothetical protein
MSITIVNKRSEKKCESVAYLLKHIKYLFEANRPDKKDRVGKRTQKVWGESICLAPKRTKLSKKKRKLIKRKLLSDLGGNDSPKVTTIISS